jgi:hypothetical protein
VAHGFRHGTIAPFLVAFGFVGLGPKRMHAMSGHLERAKAEPYKVSCGIKSQLQGEIKALQDARNDAETPSGARHREDGL